MRDEPDVGSGENGDEDGAYPNPDPPPYVPDEDQFGDADPFDWGQELRSPRIRPDKGDDDD